MLPLEIMLPEESFTTNSEARSTLSHGKNTASSCIGWIVPIACSPHPDSPRISTLNPVSGMFCSFSIRVKFSRPMVNISKRPDWRTYQESLKRDSTNKKLIKSIPKWMLVILLLSATVYGITIGLEGIQKKYDLGGDDPPSAKGVEASQIHESLISKRDVRSMLESKAFLNLKEKGFDTVVDGRHIWVDTSLDIPLQNFILSKLDRSTSRYIAIVAIEPETGRILSMSGFDKINPSGNPCIDNIFPAASVFKMTYSHL